jgi:hypothetical protein
MEEVTARQTFRQWVNVCQVCYHFLGIFFLDVSSKRLAAVGLYLYTGCETNDMHDDLRSQNHVQCRRVNASFVKIVDVENACRKPKCQGEGVNDLQR